MSHNATNWALQQRGLKPATKLVLFYLADRHNPDYGCFPSQTTLADDCEMSVRSVRNHIDILETHGFLSREHRKTGSGNYTSDRYILGFEDGFTPSPAAKAAYGKNALKPAAKAADHQRQNLPTNPVKVNSVIKPVNNPLTPKGELVDLDHEFERFWKYYPRKVGKGGAKKAFFKARKKSELVEIAMPLRGFVENLKGTPMDKIPHAATWLNQERWLDDQTHASNRPNNAEDDMRALGVQTTAADDMASLFSDQPQIEGIK